MLVDRYDETAWINEIAVDDKIEPFISVIKADQDFFHAPIGRAPQAPSR
jgi:hypothetical protein